MDGTLTNAIHDFDDIKRQLGLDTDKPILESLALLDDEVAADKHRQLDAIEYDIAAEATAQAHSDTLLNALKQNGCEVGIVTRNGHGIAKATLKACGLDTYFTDDTIISRSCCEPKPSPAGVELLLSRWSAQATDAVMVGDYLFDLEAAKRANVSTVHLDVEGKFPWPDMTDFGVVDLETLAALWY